MLNCHGQLPRFLFGLAGIITALAVIACMWLWLPASAEAVLPALSGDCQELYVCSDGGTLLSVHDHHFRLWDTASRQVRSEAAYAYDVQASEHRDLEITLSPDGRKIAFCERTPVGIAGCMWHPDSLSGPKWLAIPTASGIAGFTADSKTLVMRDGSLWDTATGHQHPRPDKMDRAVVQVRLLRDGPIIALEDHSDGGDRPGPPHLRVWNLANGSLMCDIPNGPRSVTVSPDGRLLAAQRAGMAMLFDPASGRLVADRSVSCLETDPVPQFSPDGRILLLGEQGPARGPSVGDTTVPFFSVWNMATLPPRKVGDLDESDICFSRDGDCLAVPRARYSQSKEWKILSAATLQPLYDWNGRTRGPLVFGPDSRTFAARSVIPPRGSELLEKWLPGYARTEKEDGIQIWDIATGRELAAYPGGSAFAYFPDGRKLAVAQPDGTIQLWDIPPRRPWWIEYGLPVLFGILLILAFRFRRRANHFPVSSEK